VIKTFFIVGAAILQILIGGAHLASFIASRDPARVDPLMKEVVESLAEKPLPMQLGSASRTYAELHDGFSVLFAILLITIGCLNCVAAPSCRDRRGLHFGLVMVNLAGMLGVLWACYTYYMVFPGIVCVAAAAVMFFSLFITGRGSHAPN
jgi:hypothetical protein